MIFKKVEDPSRFIGSRHNFNNIDDIVLMVDSERKLKKTLREGNNTNNNGRQEEKTN